MAIPTEAARREVNTAPGGLLARLAGAAERERARILLELVSRQVAAVVDRPAAQAIDAAVAWRQLGIFQRSAKELRARLSEAIGLRLPATAFFDHPTPAALVGYIEGELLGGRGVAAAVAPERWGADGDRIAIVGMGCRYPGEIRSPDDLWTLVAEGRDAVSGFPEGRGWDAGIYDPEPGLPGRTYAREGGFVHDVDRFDAAFFGIGPREAAALDPQQRLALEVSWEALERAGIDPASLRGSRTGVYLGIAYQDYGPSWHEPPKGFHGQLLMGSLTSAASGRIAYALGLEAPAITVDTACSSSLVALHLACQALGSGECSLALAGGVTVMATPGVFLEFSCKRGLSPSGRCRSFSDDADGTGWGEGAGMLVLERLSDAHRHGHRVLALIRGTALDQDGASNGLTAPNGLAQQRVIRQALANAGLSAHEVDAVEAHGTGTSLGDPIEAQALLATYGRNRPKGRPLLLGSLKSNIGHAQAAGAVAGIIKMAMAMERGILPRTLHVTEPSRHVDWSSGAVELLTEARPWKRAGHPRRCGISAFGVSGTNGHAILEEAPDEPDAGGAPAVLPAQPSLAAGGEALPHLPSRASLESAQATSGEGGVRGAAAAWLTSLLPCVVSGKGPAALRAQAERLRAHLRAGPDWSLADVGYSLAGRTRFGHRAVVLAPVHESLLRGLDALADGETAQGTVQGVARAGIKLAFLFTGQGSQRVGAGRSLYRAFPPFAQALDEACAHLDAHMATGRALRDVVFSRPGSSDAALLLDETFFTQAALFALEVALFRLVQAWGLAPDFLLGHSIGELAAAHVAGVLSLGDACALVAARGRLMQACPPGGAMISVQGEEAEVAASLSAWEGRVEIAAVNGPLSTVIAGDEDAAMQVAAQWRARGRATRRLRVSHAFHSPHMEGALDELRRVAGSLSFAPPAIPVVSNVTGELAAGEDLASPEYWARHVRRPVRFLDGMRSLQARGVTAFLELGPASVLAAMGPSCLTGEGDEQAVFTSVLRASSPEVATLMTALAEVHVHGVDVDWRAAFTGRGARRVDLPTYAFQRQRHWLEAPRPTGGGAERPASDGWRYRIAWEPAATMIDRPLRGTWLVLVPAALAANGRIARLLAGLEAPGDRVVRVEVDGADAHREKIRERLDEALRGGIAGVLSLLALDEAPHAEHPALPTGVALTVALAQALGDAGVRAPLWCVTRGAVSIARPDALRSPAQAMAWGLGRIAGLEQPGLWGGLVDLPGGQGGAGGEEDDERTGARLRGVLVGQDGEAIEREVALRQSGAWVRRLVRAEPPGRGEAWRPRGTTLVTGGTGALGAHCARWLARHGAKRLVLASRRGAAAPGATELVAELTALGAAVTVAACDVGDPESVAGLLRSLPERVTSVVHAAGVVGRIAPLTDTDLAEVAEVVAGKVTGAMALDAACSSAAAPLDAFVLFSSVAGMWGARGQAAYGAANAFLDALACQRRARGVKATSVAWGAWAEGGMAARDPELARHLRRHGIPPMAPSAATEALWQAVADDETSLAIIDADWGLYLPALCLGRPNPLFAAVSGPPRPVAPAAAAGAPPARIPHPPPGGESATEGGSTAGRLAWTRRLLSAPEKEREPILLELVRAHAAEILGHSGAGEVDPDARFLDLGFDSLAAVQLRTRLVDSTGLELPPAVALEHPSCTALAQLLARTWAERSSRATAASPTPEATRTGAGESATGSIRFLYRAAAERSMLEEGVQLLRAAARLRPVMRCAEDFVSPRPVRLAAGPARPALVCLPPIVAPSGPHNYAHVAAHFDGDRDVYAFGNPGFGDGEPLPASRDVVVELHASAIREHMGDAPFALMGYSSGGWVIHSVAARLESLGVFPAALIFLDSLPLREKSWERVYRPLQSLAVREESFGLTTDDQLTAMACYFDHFKEWKPAPIRTPIVLVRSTEPIPEWREHDLVEEDFWKAAWDLPLEILDVPGDHFTLMNQNAGTTAAVLRQWLGRRETAGNV
jgi:acyl transferase domain-containing protein/acyl carrier protein